MWVFSHVPAVLRPMAEFKQPKNGLRFCFGNNLYEKHPHLGVQSTELEGVMQHLRVLVVGLCLFISLAPLSAQTTTGSIVGTVSDPSGAVIAGASVSVSNMDTGIAVKTSTDSTGNYVVTPLPVGRYSVTVEAQGFKKSIRSDI